VIRHIKGELLQIDGECAVIEVNGLGYEVIVPELVADQLAARGPGAQVTLYTYYYLALDPSRATPVLLGFDSPAQLAMFERLQEVPRIGPRQAARVLAAPVSSIARAIELGDIKFLRSLPGVGAAKARDIVNGLRGKMAEFTGVDEAVPVPELPAEPSIQTDAMEALTQLGYTLSEARHRVLAALTRDPDISTADQLVAEALSDRG
jgi:Holliday junction DNA helicase RuvA